MRLQDKVAIVTGAAAGLGAAQATVLAREGAHVVLTDVDAQTGERTANEISEECEGRATFLRQDVTDEDGWRDLVAQVEAQHGGLNILVNNAGIILRGDIEQASLEDWRRVMSVNTEGTFLGIKHSLPAMRRSGGGAIVNLSSTATVQGYPNAPAYVASKGAIVSLTKAVAMHVMVRGDAIRCNAVMPHNAESPMQKAGMEAAFRDVAPEDRPKLDVGSPFAVANAVLFLASDESSDLNGECLNLDRGSSLIVGRL